MITSAEDYFDHLLEIQNKNFPKKAILLPTDEKIYEIDLNTRTIHAPKFLSLTKDHNAETIYFKFNRYFDNMDLTNTVCLIQYENKNAVNKDGDPAHGFTYLVPFYDTTYYKDEDKVLIPWIITAPVTAASGPVEFAVRFYLLNDDGSKYIYSLNTIPAISQVLHGMNVDNGNNENFMMPDSMVAELQQSINEVRNGMGVTWIDLF